jgi:hypothetical protein
MDAVIAALVALNTHPGAITVYGDPYVGRPLFCSTGSNPLYYDSDSPKWLALPFKQLGVTWQCGDLIYIPGYGLYRALDTGPFGDHCVVSGAQCLPIVADVPVIHAEWPGLSVEGEIVNLSAVARGWREWTRSRFCVSCAGGGVDAFSPPVHAASSAQGAG